MKDNKIRKVTCNLCGAEYWLMASMLKPDKGFPCVNWDCPTCSKRDVPITNCSYSDEVIAAYCEYHGISLDEFAQLPHDMN
jgi:hypothetical protein